MATIVISKQPSQDQLDESVNDPYADDFGFSEDQVCEWANQYKEVEAMKKDPKKMEAVQRYLEDESGEHKAVIKSIADIKKASAKANQKSGKPYFNDSSKVADANSPDYKEEE